MEIKSNKVYIDYLDHTVSGHFSTNDAIQRLRFDLLLFSEEILCLSVPACVKLESTTKILMKLTPFWDNGKIKLILDKKHGGNPWNYFRNRKHVLEKGFSEEQLVTHFEYSAYNSEHTNFFYDIFIKEILHSNYELYIGKIFDTDETFRQSVISQVNNNCNRICTKLPITNAIHMAKIFNDLILIAEDRKSLFQRSAIEKKLQGEYGAYLYEIEIINKILDRGFAYANGVSSYAAPLSLINNRLTGDKFINILKSSDSELYELILHLNWTGIYRLSINDIWLDFIDHLNKLLVLYQYSKKHKIDIIKPVQLECSVFTFEFLKNLYQTAINSLQVELLKAGGLTINVLNLKNHSDKMLEYVFFSKNEYWNIIKELNELIDALKITIRSIDRKYKDSTKLLRHNGFIINLN